MWRDGDPLPETLDNSETERRYKLEQQQRALEREIRRAKRRVEGFTDPENIAMAKAQLKDKQKQLRKFIDKTNADEGATVLKRDSSREKLYKGEVVKTDGNRKESYDSLAEAPQTKQDAPQQPQVSAKGNSPVEQNNAAQSSTEAVTVYNASNRQTNYSKEIDIFNESNLSGQSKIKPQDIKDNLQASTIGRETAKFAKTLKEPIELNDKTIRVDDDGGKIYGEDNGDAITIYLLNCDNAERAARTIIHECTHRKYGISRSQWAECVCFAQELKHKFRRDTLTIGEKRRIIKAVKDGYPEYNWRKGGLIHGRPKSHA